MAAQSRTAQADYLKLLLCVSCCRHQSADACMPEPCPCSNVQTIKLSLHVCRPVRLLNGRAAASHSLSRSAGGEGTLSIGKLRKPARSTTVQLTPALAVAASNAAAWAGTHPATTGAATSAAKNTATSAQPRVQVPSGEQSSHAHAHVHLCDSVGEGIATGRTPQSLVRLAPAAPPAAPPAALYLTTNPLLPPPTVRL